MIDRELEDSVNGNRESNVLPFEASRRPNLITTTARLPSNSKADDRLTVAAIVTVTRFIGEEKIHAQDAVLAVKSHAATFATPIRT
jgi:hypothetical protein